MATYPVRVIWEDAAGGKTGWMSEKDAARATQYMVESYGWLLRSDKAGVTLALSRHKCKDGSFDYADTLDVPRGMVKSVKRVK